MDRRGAGIGREHFCTLSTKNAMKWLLHYIIFCLDFVIGKAVTWLVAGDGLTMSSGNENKWCE